MSTTTRLLLSFGILIGLYLLLGQISSIPETLNLIISISVTLWFFLTKKVGGSKKIEPINQSLKEMESDLKNDLGEHFFRGGSINKLNNWANRDEVFKALGSNYPLETGNAELTEAAPNVDKKEALQTLLYRNHFDGHLQIGGGCYWDGQGHILTVGGNRSGKGTCLIIPALLSLPLKFPNAPSFVVLDPKGENLAITGNYLKNAGYNVLSINPFDIPEIIQFGNARYNPFDMFSANDPDFDKYADMISFALVPNAHHANDYFDKSARNYITLYIRHMMTQEAEPKNFRTLYKWLRLAASDRTALLQQMSKNEAFEGDIKDEATAIFGQLVNDGGRTVEGIYSTIRTVTDIFKDRQLRESVSASDIDLKTIAKEKTAIFVCLSPADLERCQIWLRLFFGSVLRSLTKYYNPARKVVLLMDEFPTMGALKEFEVGAGFLAGYNVTLWPIMQDLTQLKGLYPATWETFLNNAIIKHYLSVGDNFTAEYISKRMPIIEVGDNNHPRYEPLLRPDEVLTDNSIITEIKGMSAPASFYKSPYWKMGFVKNVAKPNPFRS